MSHLEGIGDELLRKKTPEPFFELFSNIYFRKQIAGWGEAITIKSSPRAVQKSFLFNNASNIQIRGTNARNTRRYIIGANQIFPCFLTDAFLKCISELNRVTNKWR